MGNPTGSPETYQGAFPDTDSHTVATTSATYMQEQLDRVASRRNIDLAKPPPRSKYPNVYVLLLSWADDDLGVIKELELLNQLFKTKFNFTTHTWTIPSKESEHELMNKVTKFRQGKNNEGDLIILYYGGHAYGDPQECIWAANERNDSPTLNWHTVQGYLLGSFADVLLILDCCFATLAVRNYGIGDNWFFGASTKESLAAGVSRSSFTSALIRQLDRNADRYWESIERFKRNPNRWEKDPRFTIEDIHHALNTWERDIQYTPSKVRLTDHACEPTELTPLLPPRLQSARTDPYNQTLPVAADPALPMRPPLSHATLPYSEGDVPQGQDFSASTRGISIELSTGESQTVRMIGFPPSTTKSDLIHWLEARLSSKLPISRIGPMVASSTTAVTVTFTSVAIAKQALAIRDNHFHPKIGTPPSPIEIENDFQGLTCLYLPASPPAPPPTLDVVLVHGAHGHAINSFASHFTSPSRESLWAIDSLPKALKTAGIVPRIMTYGWDANSWLKPQASVYRVYREYESFVAALRHERSGISKRPIVFIGHGVGGLLVKQAVNEIINCGFGEDDFENPVKACFFFAVPHHPSESAGDFASILASMDAVLQGGGPANQNLARSLTPRNQPIMNLSAEFDGVRQENSITTISFHEELRIGDNFVVPKDSAVMEESPRKAYAIAANYRDIVRLSKIEQTLQMVVNLMTNAVAAQLGLLSSEIDSDEAVPGQVQALGDRPSKANDKERIYGRLQQYDTLFIVDDSDSMYGVRWKTTAHILAKIASIAVKYDKNGVDVRFFNNRLEDSKGLNLDSSEKVMALFREVEPDGPTLTADILEEELSDYVYEYGKDRHRKGLNVIILTDGEPERGQDVEATIVKYAKKLEGMSAKPLQVGLQFVQIGGDEQVARFLKTLDDDLQKKHGLDRDMIDTVLWVEGLDEYHLVEKILLGGILKHLDNED